MKHTEIRLLKRMRENLQNNIKMRIAFLAVVIVLSTLVILDCTNHYIYNNERNIQKEEEVVMSETAQIIRECIKCSDVSAVNIEKAIYRTEISDIKTIVLCDDKVYKILKITTTDDTDYYVYVGMNNIVEKINKDTPDGKCILKVFF